MTSIQIPANYNRLNSGQRKAVRQEYVKRQKGLCCFCGTRLTEAPKKEILLAKVNKNLFPPNFFTWPVHLHHDHHTGLTIGAVHNKCNAVLWQYFGE